MVTRRPSAPTLVSPHRSAQIGPFGSLSPYGRSSGSAFGPRGGWGNAGGSEACRSGRSLRDEDVATVRPSVRRVRSADARARRGLSIRGWRPSQSAWLAAGLLGLGLLAGIRSLEDRPPTMEVAAGVAADGVVATSTYLVRPGDSLWSIAEELAPGQDPRPLVHWMSEANGGSTLRAGQELVIPATDEYGQ